MGSPAVSVITAVYNGEKHVEQCLESIFNQTFGDYEHVLVDDGSTDRTPEILSRWAAMDSRIRVLRNDSNRGRSTSRNRAITAARGELIAVLDADDYSLPERLEKQFEFMKENAEVQILGGDFLIHGTDKILKHFRHNDEIRADLYFDSGLFHSTVMMRKSILKQTGSWYDANLSLAQDYGLWVNLMYERKAIFANLPIPLTWYRLAENPRQGYAEKQFKYANIVRSGLLSHVGVEPNKKNMSCHLALLYRNAEALGVTPADCAAYGEKLSRANAKTPLTNPETLDEQISRRLRYVYAANSAARES